MVMNFVDLPIDSMVDLSIVFGMSTRGYSSSWMILDGLSMVPTDVY